MTMNEKEIYAEAKRICEVYEKSGREAAVNEYLESCGPFSEKSDSASYSTDLWRAIERYIDEEMGMSPDEQYDFLFQLGTERGMFEPSEEAYEGFLDEWATASETGKLKEFWEKIDRRIEGYDAEALEPIDISDDEINTYMASLENEGVDPSVLVDLENCCAEGNYDKFWETVAKLSGNDDREIQ